MNLSELIQKYLKDGYQSDTAFPRVCQDIILYKIARTSISQNITIKGGVVMMGISKDSRRATRDIDLDFIKYSLSNEAIEKFIDKLNIVEDGIIIKIIRNPESLNHKDYKGKRVYIKIIDKYNNSLETKLDIGVHNDFEIEQDDFCFDLSNLNDSVSLLVNSKEQIFTEKLKSLFKYGFTSSRYKDIFDFYYLINMTSLSKDRLLKYFNI